MKLKKPLKVEGALILLLKNGRLKMTVHYDRSKTLWFEYFRTKMIWIALHLLEKTVGNVFEGEKRFDMVIRLIKPIDKILTLYVSAPNGEQIPLQE
jgi:cobalt-zinc-cadmium resistance protein CzcA